eukprot:g5177.t1
MGSTDRAALVALYEATGGPNWAQNENWNTDADLSQWHGIDVTGQGRVLKLGLRSNNLEGFIPKELGALTKLELLDVCNNQLTGEIPASLGRLSKLQVLYLYENQITGSIPKELGALTELKELSLRGNKLTGSIPTELEALAELKELWLSNNKLAGVIPKELRALSKLRTLRLNNNELTGEIPASLGQLGNLRSLYLNDNKLNGRIPPQLGNLSLLKHLNLSWNKLNGPIPKELGALSELEEQELSLQGNQLAGDIPRRMGGLYLNLKELGGATTEYNGIRVSQEGASSGKDCLNYHQYAQALAGLFKTGDLGVLPAAVGIYAPWGAGKRNILVDIESVGKKSGGARTSFIFVDFNAWEYAGSEVLWAALVSKIFNAVEEHLGRGAVRAARVTSILEDPSWTWSGFLMLYTIVAVLGIAAVVLLNEPNAVQVVQWVLSVLGLSGVPTLLLFLFQMRSQGRIGTAQGVLRRAASKRESVGASFRGFMSEVKDELKILFGEINKFNRRASLDDDEDILVLAVTVDDLDRCSHEKIMEMLTATHLLLEQPEAPMAIFVAVDPQLIISAIVNSGGVANKMKALQYLDKIIHIPFCLPRASRRDRLKFLDSLIKDNSCEKTLSRFMTRLQSGEKVDRVSKSGMFKHLVRQNPVWAGTRPTESTKKAMKNAEALLTKVPCALELVYCLDIWSSKLTSLERAALDEFMQGLMKIASIDAAEAMNINLARAETIDAKLEKLNRVINATGETSLIERESSPPQRLAPNRGDFSPAPACSSSEGVRSSTSSTLSGANTSAGSITVSDVPSDGRSTTDIRYISLEEEETFVKLFRVVHAPPRKIKRVVNLYFLMRAVALASSHRTAALWMENGNKELVTWAVLAEFWPFRMSCILRAIQNGEVPTGTGGLPIYDVYTSSRGKSISVKGWIHAQRARRQKNGTADFYLFDEAEEEFLKAMDAGVSISEGQAINFFVQYSFNLNPAIMSAVELAMADHPITTESSVHDEAKSNASRRPQMAEEAKAGTDPGELYEGGSGNRTAGATKSEVSTAKVVRNTKIDSYASEDPMGAKAQRG